MHVTTLCVITSQVTGPKYPQSQRCCMLSGPGTEPEMTSPGCWVRMGPDQVARNPIRYGRHRTQSGLPTPTSFFKMALK
ncbi:hypothetical protein RRG08_042701 [Elysia crispata]|uniref:Uncharacterized protein n=1 Tax=Elysia crispata TaxID=231223 RepID=A0AAE0XQM7_9GAST|nr:hypothetical protein RRG08_042701 [Elysia crispata]